MFLASKRKLDITTTIHLSFLRAKSFLVWKCVLILKTAGSFSLVVITEIVLPLLAWHGEVFDVDIAFHLANFPWLTM